ncbi:hypothetical protein C4561_04700 [candidate division WWE3 bacterium]|uniref:Uncharacterized protein n=1 Tax=candidate division WWE3 bacterium TaxID=2053526 RepID=A0A3A4ZJE5_UNCKA|nr:MAG: hypothetical protein C4561_04700 [candidate division WWE3 bacterium]
MTDDQRKTVEQQLDFLYDKQEELIELYRPSHTKIHRLRIFFLSVMVLGYFLGSGLAMEYIYSQFPYSYEAATRQRQSSLSFLIVLAATFVIGKLLLDSTKPTKDMIKLELEFEEIDRVVKLKQRLIGFRGFNPDITGRRIYYGAGPDFYLKDGLTASDTKDVASVVALMPRRCPWNTTDSQPWSVSRSQGASD